MLKSDREILRELANRYREIADSSIQQTNINNWKKLNGLNPSKPMIVIDQIPWHEMNINDELTIKCKDPYCQSLEWSFREKIYKWKHFPCDMVLTNHFKITKCFTDTGIGVSKQVSDDDKLHAEAKTHIFKDNIPDEASLGKLHIPTIIYDEQGTKKAFDLSSEFFGDIIPIELTGVSLWAAIWDRIVFWRGATVVLYDLIDRPEFIHSLMKKLICIEMNVLDQYEKQNLLGYNADTCHYSYTYNDELPSKDFDPNNIKARDCWVSGAAQIFSEVSPAMHDEFEIEYLKPYYDRFGLVNYGCCEPLHKKIDIIRKIKNVRLISISPWADVDIAAEAMGRDYVMARKPNPAFVASGNVDEESVKKEIRETLRACNRNNTPVAFILKDVTTVGNNPECLSRWYEIVKEEIENF